MIQKMVHKIVQTKSPVVQVTLCSLAITLAFKCFMKVNDSRQNHSMRLRYSTQIWRALRLEKKYGSLTSARSNG